MSLMRQHASEFNAFPIPHYPSFIHCRTGPIPNKKFGAISIFLSSKSVGLIRHTSQFLISMSYRRVTTAVTQNVPPAPSHFSYGGPGSAKRSANLRFLPTPPPQPQLLNISWGGNCVGKLRKGAGDECEKRNLIFRWWKELL